MRTVLRTVAIIATVALVVILAFAMSEKGQSRVGVEKDPVVASSTVDKKGPSPAQTSQRQEVEAPVDVETFAATFANGAMPKDRWLAALMPVTTPALHSSLRSMDRPLASKCGKEIIDVSDEQAVLGTGGQPGCSLTLRRIDAVESGRAQDGVQVATVDFIESQNGARPIDGETEKTLEAEAQKTAVIVVSQPGGYTDADRKAAITAHLKAPAKVWSIKRFGSEAEAIRVGEVRDYGLTSTEDGKLAATMTVPYAKDGQRAPQWVFLTLIYGRGASGEWVLEDVSQ
ncbi:MAG: hypothetical protein E7A06_12290 [Clostridiales bacterium]|nr:hypothetical protein [Clostridiales bacterium]